MLNSIKTLCEKYSQVSHRERLVELFRDFDRVLVTSSFGTTSVMLLHLIHQVKPDHPVHFIDTTYHFPETWQYAEDLVKRLNLKVITVPPDPDMNVLTRQNRAWRHDPDFCCYVNKVRPIKDLRDKHDIWISGMLGGQDSHRKDLPIFKWDGDILRFYPFIDLSPEDAKTYQFLYELPPHPLEVKGYDSIGCLHCTRKGKGRAGRWAGFAKTECGLHTFKR